MVGLSNKAAFHYALGIFFVWLLSGAFIFTQVIGMRTVVEAVAEIGNKIEEIHASFAEDRALRIQREAETSLDVQLIYALRIQLEASYLPSFFSPDITQFIHSTDRFLDNVKAMLAIDSELSDLVAEIRHQRNLHAQSESLLPFALLGSYLSEATLSNSIRLSPVFKDIDNLMLVASDLPEQPKVALQKLLAKTAIVLGKNAEINHLLHQLSNHEVYTQQSSLEEYYHRLVYQAIAMVITSSLLCFLGLLALLFCCQRKQALTTTIQNDEPDAANAKALRSPLPTSPESTPPLTLPVGQREPYQPLSSEVAECSPPIQMDLMMESLSGDEESVLMLLNVFVQDHADEHQHFLSAIETDREKAQRIVHSLKGVAANLGADDLRKVSTEIEMTMRENREPTQVQLDTLNHHLLRTVDYARQIIDKYAHKQPIL